MLAYPNKQPITAITYQVKYSLASGTGNGNSK